MRRKLPRGVIVTRDGRFRARRWDGRTHVSLGVYDTAEEAARVVVAAERLAQPRPPGMSFLEYGARWLDRREESGRIRGIRQERNRWRVHVATWPAASMPIVEIKREHVARFARSLMQKPATRSTRDGQTRETGATLSRQTAAHVMKLVREAFRAACDEGVISKDPAADVRLDRGDASSDWTWLRPDEIGALLGLELAPVERAALAVSIFAGLRRGELWGLRWEHVHLDRSPPILEVRRSYDGPPKTRKAIRDVAMLPPAAEALRALRDSLPARPISGLVFPRATDGACRTSTDDLHWRDKPRWVIRADGRRERVVEPGLKTRAGIRRRVRWHDLRHTCASHLVQGTWGQTWPLEAIAAYLGHSSIQVTQRYAHLCPDGLHAAVRSMSEAWGRTEDGHRGGKHAKPRDR